MYSQFDKTLFQMHLMKEKIVARKTFTQKDIVAIAKNQRTMLSIILLRILLIILFVALKDKINESYKYLFGAADIAIALAMIYRLVLWLKSMKYNIILIVLVCLLFIIPIIGFLTLFLVNSGVMRLLKEAGMKVGFMGVSPYDIAAYENQIKKEAQMEATANSSSMVEPLKDNILLSQQPISARTFQTIKGSSFFHKAAKASWVIPLIAFFIGLITLGMREKIPSTYIMVYGIANITLIVISFLLAFISLFGIGSYGRRGIIGSAIMGIIINSFFILCFFSLFDAIKDAKRKNEVKREQELQEAEEMGEKSYLEYPGWLGAADFMNATISIGSLHDQSPMIIEMRKEFSAKFSLLIIAIDNTSGKTAININPSIVSMQHANGAVVKAIPTTSVLNTAYKEKAEWLERYSRNADIPVGRSKMDIFSFIPAGTDMRTIKRIAVNVNGKPLIIDGEYLSVERKKELDRIGREAMKKTK